MNNIGVVIPTYNEKDNVSSLLTTLRALPVPISDIIIVDDNSPDGTANYVAQMQKHDARITILRRHRKEGLGPAYRAGIHEALARKVDVVCTLDADGSHDPNALPLLLQSLQCCDVVLGSRYIKGGCIQNWNLFRRVVSRLGNLYARRILRLPFLDLTGGFKCYRRNVLERMNIDALSSEGYVFQIETTYYAYRNGALIQEVPIIFTERVQGRSKFNVRIVWESFFKVIALRLR